MRSDPSAAPESPEAPAEPAAAENAARAEWMSVLAKAPADRLAALWAESGLDPAFAWLRAPETGAVMLRGRAGGTGAPFNLGEMTATRCALRLTDAGEGDGNGDGASGPVGHAWVQGRDKAKARLAALCDALMADGRRARVEAEILAPLRAEAAARRRDLAARAAATKVDFFTMVRGEDA